MTGSLRPDAKPPERRVHDHVDIVFDDGSLLRYRRSEALRRDAVAPDRPPSHPLLRDLGPEPFDPAFDADYFWRMTRSRTAAIKLALMDSHLVVGVGNIYANESLFRAGIRRRPEGTKVATTPGRGWSAKSATC
jgi:formamidopyrimidine-DNA glycosylase